MNLFYENIFNRSKALHPGSYWIQWNNAYKAIMWFKVIQVHRFLYQSEAHIWLPISH